MASVVRQSQTGAESEISFDRQVPLVDCRVLKMDIPSLLEELRSGLSELGWERIRERERGLPVYDRLVVERLIRAVDRVRRAQQCAE